MSTIVFILINLVLFAGVLFFLSSAGTTSGILENVHSKKLALSIDNMQPDSEIWLTLGDLYDLAEKNNLPENEVVTFDLAENKITIKLTRGAGHSFYYFTKIKEITKGSADSDIIIIKT